MNRYFIDTGFLIALEAKSDQYHGKAKAFWAEFATEKPKLVTSSYVLDEITAYFTRAHQTEKAVQIGESLMHSGFVDFIHVDEELFLKGWNYLKKHNDKEYSLTDCLSFVIMKDEKITNALTFDHHFEQAGFQVFPRV